MVTGTALEERAARAEQWREELGFAFSGLTPEAMDPPGDDPARGLDGRMSAANLGRAGAFRVAGTPQIVRRTAASIAAAPADPLKVCIQQTGRAVIHQGEREVVIGPGELALYDTGRPYALRLEDRWSCAVMTIPREALGVAECALTTAMQHAFRVDSGPGAVLAYLLRSTLASPGEIRDAVAAERLGEAGLQLMASLVSIDVPERDLFPASSRTNVAADALRARVLDFVRANLADPDLTHTSVAAAHHMSARTLHRLFETEPHTVAETIRLLRLEAIRRDLSDPNQARRPPVMVVASRWGYADLSHLTRSFRAQYGITPGVLRRS